MKQFLALTLIILGVLPLFGQHDETIVARRRTSAAVAITFVGAQNQNNASNNTASSAITLQVGDKIIAYTATAAVAQTTTCADSAGDIFTATPAGQTTFSGLDLAEMWYAVAGTAGSTTFSCAASSSGSASNIFLVFRGGLGSGIIDIGPTQSLQSSITSYVSTTYTTASANEVSVLCIDATTNPKTAGLIGGASATVPTNGAINATFRPGCEYLIHSSVQTSITAAMTLNSSGNAGGHLGVFK